jgi:2-hydroxycyclohexanecarboxyl-CoA dehydrogenase
VCDIAASGAVRRREASRAPAAALGLALDDSASSVAAGAERIEAQLGASTCSSMYIDIPAFFLESKEADWDRWGGQHEGRAALHAARCPMTERKRGRVINIASDAGRVGAGGEAVYSATKGAVIAFTKALAREVARYDVTVNAVCPGATDTALLAMLGDFNPKLHANLVRGIPLRRIGQPADVAGAVAYLASDAAAYITGSRL